MELEERLFRGFGVAAGVLPDMSIEYLDISENQRVELIASKAACAQNPDSANATYASNYHSCLHPSASLPLDAKNQLSEGRSYPGGKANSHLLSNGRFKRKPIDYCSGIE